MPFGIRAGHANACRRAGHVEVVVRAAAPVFLRPDVNDLAAGHRRIVHVDAAVRRIAGRADLDLRRTRRKSRAALHVQDAVRRIEAGPAHIPRHAHEEAPVERARPIRDAWKKITGKDKSE